MNSANIPPEEVSKAISDAQAILLASGVDKSDVQTIVNDMKAIAAEAQKNTQNAAANAQSKTQGAQAKAAGLRGRFKR